MSYARWATKDEVADRISRVNLETGVAVAGVPIGFDDEYLHIDTREAHNLIIGSTGSGKTQAIILPMAKLSMLAGESFILHDPKGEIYRLMSLTLQDRGFKVLALDFRDAKFGNAWNPLTVPYQLYHSGEIDKATQCLEDLAYYLFFDNSEKNADPFWLNSIMDYFMGISLYLFENASLDEVHLESVSAFSNYLSKKKNAESFMEGLPSSSKIYLNLVGTLMAPEDTRGSIVALFNQKIKKYISRVELSNMLSFSDFDLNDLGFSPTALFIIGGGEADCCCNLIPLFIHQAVRCVDFRGKCPKCFHILLDEFDSLVPIRNFSCMIDAARSLAVRFTITIRSYVHLCSMYSRDEAEILRMCFGNLIYLLSDDIYTLESFSKYCGVQMVDGVSTPLVTVEDLRTIGTFEGIIIMPRLMPFKTKFLPDYKIDWGVEFLSNEISLRKKSSLKIYDSFKK